MNTLPREEALASDSDWMGMTVPPHLKTILSLNLHSLMTTNSRSQRMTVSLTTRSTLRRELITVA